MGTYLHFYVEARTAAGWGVPAGFRAEPWSLGCHEHLGQFAWLHPRDGAAGLFRGPRALFPLRRGRPADRAGSAFFLHLDAYYDYDRDEEQLSWLPYEELFVDCWDRDTVLVAGPVPARHALLFGDGRGPFPAAELAAAGVAADAVEGLRAGRLAEGPVDTAFGAFRFQLSRLPPEQPVDVTWAETIGAFLGEPCASAFKGLRRYGPDEDLRILATLG